MFKKIEKKIVLSIVITISLCTILSSIATYFIIRRNILSNFIPLALQSATQQNNNLDLFLDLTTESSKLLAGDPEISRILQKTHTTSGEFLRTIDKLNEIQASNLNIIGLTLYGINGIFYPSNPSNNTANSTPDLSLILKDPVIRKFMRQPDKTLWFDRFQSDYWITDLTLNLYLNSGVFTFAQKLYGPRKKIIGLLMTDITIDSVYRHFRNSKFQADTYLFAGRRGILKTPYSRSLPRPESKEIVAGLPIVRNHFLAAGGRNIVIFHRIPHSRDVIVRVVPLTDIMNQIHQLLFFLLLINLILIGLAVVLGLAISRSISWPLGDLYLKMQKFIKI